VTSRQPLWIEERDVLAIHDRLLAIHGGAPGLRDRGLLQSALARPRQHHAYGNSGDIVAMAALYIAGVIGNHPFVDGNKRTGFVIGVLFLELHGFEFKANEEEATRAVFALAAGTFDETEFGTWLRSNAKLRRKR
jgi:death on curing protein